MKFHYAGIDGITETEAGLYIADGKTKDGEYIEVQTTNFNSIIKKVKHLIKSGNVRIIHPVAVTKIIETYEPSNKPANKEKFLHRRKSPKKGSPWSLFNVLIHAPTLPLIKGVTIELVLADITEIRLKDGKGAWRRKGISIKDHVLTRHHESIHLKKRSDYRCFIPFKKNEEITSSLFAERAGIDIGTARKAVYVLAKMKLIKKTGKKGNAIVYERA